MSLSHYLGELPSAASAEMLRAQLVPRLRQWLEEERGAQRKAFIATGDAERTLIQNSEMVDSLVAALHALRPATMAIIAVGGYGRRELFPFSDIDIVFLYEQEHAQEAAAAAEFILYILWDMGFHTGQAHRTLEDSLLQAKEDVTVRTSLLDARYVAGACALYDRFAQRFSEEITAKSVPEFIEAKLLERDERHQRWGDSRYMLEPNVKEGKGGLRDLQTLWWLARYAYPITQVKDLVEMGRLTAQEYQDFERVRHFLCKVRVCLHYEAGRAEERLTFDRQHAIALMMGFTHPSANRAIERFMRRYFVAVRIVGAITRIFCALLEVERKRRPRISLGWLWYSPWSLNGFTLDGERLSVSDDTMFEEDPVRMLELFYIAQKEDLDVHPRALQLVARSLTRIDHELQHDPRANALFLDMLLSPKGPEITLRRLSEAGVLGRFIPDFGRIIGQTQFNMYHVYTVDEHTLVALGILHAIEKGNLRSDFPLASGLIHRLRMRRVLFVALFCHDIAKGRGGDHSEMGEKIVTRLAQRLGFSPEETDTAAWLVRQHLLFTHTAFKRDINDPKTVQDFVAAVRTSERLKLLLVLTVADICAVGPHVWNAWKGALLRELYAKAEKMLGVGRVELRQQETQLLRQGLLRALPDWREEEIDRYLAEGTPALHAYCDQARHALIARLVRMLDRDGLPLAMETRHDADNRITEITLCAADQHGLFSKVAAAMSLGGANIINAKIFTLKNGVAIDIFHVQDMAGELFDRPDRLARLSVYIERALSGTLNLDAAFAPQPAYMTARREAVQVASNVTVENDASAIHSVIEVTGPDRPGLLYDITQALAELGIAIATAHISTYGAQASDVFYVKDIFGMKITHEAKLRQIRERLLASVGKE